MTAERVWTIGVLPLHNKMSADEANASHSELQELVLTLGGLLAGSGLVLLRAMRPSTLLGQGKVEELKQQIQASHCHLVVVDHVLSPVQNRNLEQIWQTRVLDRTGLILALFASRAKSRAGQLQVELAQYAYLLPRLVGAWTHLSKQRGGIGLKGPGETQLEVDRRRIRERMATVRKKLKDVSRTRQLHRNNRAKIPVPTVSLVGYTNAGKSSLFNALTKADEWAVDKLFATLDPKTKRLYLPNGPQVLLSDTVGFIRHLPHDLVEAFKSTFEEVSASALLLHVVDATHPHLATHIAVVQDLLTELQLIHKPTILVYNKCDKLPDIILGGGIKVSALTGFGLNELRNEISRALTPPDFTEPPTGIEPVTY